MPMAQRQGTSWSVQKTCVLICIWNLEFVNAKHKKSYLAEQGPVWSNASQLGKSVKESLWKPVPGYPGSKWHPDKQNNVPSQHRGGAEQSKGGTVGSDRWHKTGPCNSDAATESFLWEVQTSAVKSVFSRDQHLAKPLIRHAHLY